jgi:cobaltochelatase CobS
METIEGPHGLMAFMRGEISADLEQRHDAIRADLDRLEQEQADLKTGNREAIIETLKDIVGEHQIQPDDSPDQVPLVKQLLKGTGLIHAHMPLLETSVQARVPVWLHGEAGSGKSTAAEKVADETGMEFRSISLCPTTSKSDLLGYRDATGQYRSTAFRDTYEHGGVFLFDEIDNAHPSSLAVMNHALANDIAEFPDKAVERHPDAIIIAAANTLGRGANAQYVGRAVIDAATRDRFVYIPWDIDEALEEHLVDPKSRVQAERLKLNQDGIPNAREWLKIVRDHRHAMSELGIRQLCSPRATIYGEKMAELGMGRYWLKELCIYKGMGNNERDKITRYIKNPAKAMAESDSSDNGRNW